jgi:hypothetical protein
MSSNATMRLDGCAGGNQMAREIVSSSPQPGVGAFDSVCIALALPNPPSTFTDCDFQVEALRTHPSATTTSTTSPYSSNSPTQLDKMRPTPALRLQATRILRMGHGPDPKNGVYVHALRSFQSSLRTHA